MDLKKLLDAINEKKVQIQNLVNENKLTEAKEAKAELVAMQEKYDLLSDIVDNGGAAVPATATPVKDNDPAKDAIHEFANAARHRFSYSNVNREGGETGADGGYTVPEDIQTRINQYRESHFSLQDLVDYEVVKTNKGRRTYRTRASHSGFQKVDEMGKIPKVNGPTYGVLNYNIEKYGGYLPVTDELLADSDANIVAELTNWLGEEDLATRNNLVITAMKTATHTVAITGIDDFKDAVNVTLGSKFAGLVSIVTNDDGFNWLDKLKVSAGSNEYLLKPNRDQSSPIKYELAVGASRIPVVVIPNEVLASVATTEEDVVTSVAVPFFTGALKEFCKIFDRQRMSIKQSTDATVGTGDNQINAFEQDMTVFRALDRLDCEVKDDAALVYGTLTIELGE